MDRVISFFVCAVLFLTATGCGVKGAPIPPNPPAYLGRGKPDTNKKETPVPLKKKTQNSGATETATERE